MPNLYEILGLSVDASQIEIDSAMKTFRLIFKAEDKFREQRMDQAVQRYGDNQFNTKIQMITGFSQEIAEIVRDYFDEYSMLLAERNSKLSELVFLNTYFISPRDRYQYDQFVLNLKKPSGIQYPSEFFKTGAMYSQFYYYAGFTKLTPLVQLSAPRDSCIDIQSVMLDRPARALVLRIQSDEADPTDLYELKLIKNLMEHPNYPISKADLLPGHEDVGHKLFRVKVPFHAKVPFLVILEPTALLSFIQQYKHAFSLCPLERRQGLAKINMERLVQFEQKITQLDHNINTPLPFECLQREMIRRSCGPIATCVEGNYQKMVQTLAVSGLFGSNAKQENPYMETLSKVRQFMAELMNYQGELADSELATALEYLSSALEKYPQAAEILSHVAKVASLEQRQNIQKNIGLFIERNVVHETLIEILKVEAISQIVEEYLEEEPTHGLMLNLR